MFAEVSSYPAGYDMFTVGAGYLDINAAVNSSAIAPSNQRAFSPVSYSDPSSGNVMASSSFGVLCGNPGMKSTSAAPLYGAPLCTDNDLYNGLRYGPSRQ